MSLPIIPESTFQAEEGWLCLDFANTLDWRLSAHPVEMLNTYNDLIGWGQEKRLFSELQANGLRAGAARHPEQAQEALREARELRETIARLMQAHLSGKSPAPEDLEILNRRRAQHAPQLLVVPGEEHYTWAWAFDPSRLDWMLGIIAHSAAGLLTSEALERVGICADETGCGWLFYDTSRNRSRRWCNMESCGNRAKARGHYKRMKSSIQ